MERFAHSAGNRAVSAGESVVRGADGVEHMLSPLAMAVWAAADGTRGVTDLMDAAREVDASTDRERIFAILDDLASVGLLAERVTPPAAPTLGRRSLFKTLAATAAAAAVLTPMVASAAQDTCQDADAYRKAEETQKDVEGKVQKQEKQVKQDRTKNEASYKKTSFKSEEKRKQLVDKQESSYKKLQKKGGDEAQQEELQKQQTKELAAFDSEVSEEKQKFSTSQEELDKESASYEAAGCCKEKRHKSMEHWHKRRAQFGSGPSLVYIDLANGLTLEAQTRLETIAQEGEAGCALQMSLTFDGLAEGTDAGALAKTLLAVAEKGEKASLQWGAEGEFAATGTFGGAQAEVTGTSLSTGKPTSTRVGVWFYPSSTKL